MTSCSARFIEHKPLLHYWFGACCVLNGSAWKESTEASGSSFPQHNSESEYAILNYPSVINLGATKNREEKNNSTFCWSREL